MPYPSIQKVSGTIRITDGKIETEFMIDNNGKQVGDELAQLLILRDILDLTIKDYERDPERRK